VSIKVNRDGVLSHAGTRNDAPWGIVEPPTGTLEMHFTLPVKPAPPWMHAGNMDNKELVAGTTLYIPVHAPGALFEVGDGHAGQGNGEIDITAMETFSGRE
jgi:acetamidase/formamidase